MKDRFLLLPLMLLLAGSLVHIFFGQAGSVTSIHARGLDDAYISFRYAENLIHGEGLVYNPGERVEGYSNLLHVLVAAVLLLFIDRDQIYPAISLFNLAVLAVGFWIFFRHARRCLGPRTAFVAGMLLSLAPALWAWSASGMETILVWTIQVWIWHLVDSWVEGSEVHRRLAIALGLAVFARTDGFLLIALLVAFFLWRREPDRALRAGLLGAPSVILLFGARWLYYGQWMPNTYYTHISGPLVQRLATSTEQLLDLSFLQGHVVYFLVALFIFGNQLLRREPRRTSFGPFLAAGIVVYWLYIGGDHFVDRFLLILIPIGIVHLLELFRDVQREAAGRFVVALALVVQLHPLILHPRFLYGTEHYDGWITLGRYLGKRHQDVLLAVDAAGKIPYFSGLPAIDMRGITEPKIARTRVERFGSPGHNKTDPDYILKRRRPELVVTWINPDLDGTTGLTRQRYENAGYRIAGLANSSSRSRKKNFIKVRGWKDSRLSARIADGYRLAVLELRPDG